VCPTSVNDEEEHVFNDDLLINEGDLEWAHRNYPRIAHILDHPALRVEFAKFERLASEAKQRVRFYGFVAVDASAVALLALVTRPIWPHASWTRWPAGILELGGLFAALFAIGGLWSGKWKRRWLRNRLMTERLRQWHFQRIVRCGSEVESSCTGRAAMESFKQQRDLQLNHFIGEYKGHSDNELESVIRDPLESIAWLQETSSSYDPKSNTTHEVFGAYERLRFRHQYGFATYKLKAESDEPFWKFLQWPAKAQLVLLSGLSSTFFTIALILSALLICGDFFAYSENLEVYLRTAAIAVAILGAALRTIQDGLGLDADIERYREYREKIGRLYDRFKNTNDTDHRLRLMTDLEYASVDEMQDFLRAHYKARFVLA
jgi:hypothetical protein